MVSNTINCIGHDRNFLKQRQRRLSLLIVLTGLFGLFSESSGFASSSVPATRRSTKSTSPLFVSQTIIDPCTESIKPKKRRIRLRNIKLNQEQRIRWRRRLGLLSRREQEDFDYQLRKEEWAERFTHIDALRETFGSNQHKLWGDLDARTARRLYKTLLPRSLLALYNVGVRPEDLAPLAYQARVAAKLYARERCQLPARTVANLYDGLRQWKRYGEFQPRGMSYDQVWSKYASQIQEELDSEDDLTEEDVTAKICFKILERSCKTNEGIDRMVLRGEEDATTSCLMHQGDDFFEIVQQLERDAKELLNPSTEAPVNGRSIPARRIRTLRMIANAKRRFAERNKQRQCDETLCDEVSL